jgi:hypothetical protein
MARSNSRGGMCFVLCRIGEMGDLGQPAARQRDVRHSLLHVRNDHGEVQVSRAGLPASDRTDQKDSGNAGLASQLGDELVRRTLEDRTAFLEPG